MATIVRMPRLSDTMINGKVSKWYRKVGDKLVDGDVLAEIETDKMVMELENFENATLLAFFVNIGDEVPIDTPLLLLGEPGEELDLEEDLASLVKGTKNSSHAMLEKEQKVYLSRNGFVYGPYSIQSINNFLEKEMYHPKELAWTPGVSAWKKLFEMATDLGIEIDETSLIEENSVSKNAKKIWLLLENNELEFALDLVRGINDINVCKEILQSVRLIDNDWYSNIKIPSFVDHEHGVILFLVCLEKLFQANQVPENFQKIKRFILRRFIPMKYLNALKPYRELKELSLDVSEAAAEDFKVFKHFAKLEKLSLVGIDEGANLDFISNLRELKNLELKNCKVADFKPVFGLSNLINLTINSSPELKNVQGLSKGCILKSINLSQCSSLEDIKSLENAKFLEEINLAECKKLHDISSLASLENLKLLDISWCDQLTGPIPEWILSIENLYLEGLEWQINRIGVMLAKTPASNLKIIWNGSGDDGYFERFAYDKEGVNLEDDETNQILGLVENFVMCKLPGGAGNDGGSYGVMNVDVLGKKAVWDFYWNDGLDFFRKQIDLCSEYHFLRFEFEFVCFEDHESYEDLKDTNDGNWQWCFYGDGPMGLSIKNVLQVEGDRLQKLPIEQFSDMENMFSEWSMNTYYGEVDDVLQNLCEGCKDKLPDYLLDRYLIVELNCLQNEVTLKINDRVKTIDLEIENEIEIYDL